jgi:hypothetical protein
MGLNIVANGVSFIAIDAKPCKYVQYNSPQIMSVILKYSNLLAQIPLDEPIDSVYTDGAYDTKHCRQVILDRDAHAIIPPRKNAKPWKDQQARSIERNNY